MVRTKDKASIKDKAAGRPQSKTWALLLVLVVGCWLPEREVVRPERPRLAGWMQVWPGLEKRDVCVFRQDGAGDTLRYRYGPMPFELDEKGDTAWRSVWIVIDAVTKWEELKSGSCAPAVQRRAR